MKTKEQHQSAIDEILSVCKKHGVVIVGTVTTDGVCREMTISEASKTMFILRHEDNGWNVKNILISTKLDENSVEQFVATVEN